MSQEPNDSPASGQSPAPASEQNPTPTPGQTPGQTPTPASEQSSATSEANIDDTRQSNGHKNGTDDPDAESELSEPDSNLHSPTAPINLNTLEDEIVVGARANGANKGSPRQPIDQDEEMEDADDGPVASHYPKRKRNQAYSDLSESRIEIATTPDEDKGQSTPSFKAKQSRPSVRGVVLGTWRDSPVPDHANKHAVIGFIDVRDRLRTRIQPNNRAGESLAQEYPLPPGPGGSWVTFERVVFHDHLVGLDQSQVKEYVRQRSDIEENTEEERKAADLAAVKEAIRRCREKPASENPAVAPVIAYGQDLPETGTNTPIRPDKRRRTSNGYTTINPSPSGSVGPEPVQPQQLPQVMPIRSNTLDPLLGTRPTRILLGYWKGSSEPDPINRHAVYGILGQNDMFRVKLVRESRDGRFVDGNFPTGAGALWIQWEEVEFEPHLKPLLRSEIKEYCRVRQWQIDHGEMQEQRAANEKQAVIEAQARAGAGFKHVNQPIAPAPPPPPPAMEDYDIPREETNGIRPVPGAGGHELRQSRRVDARSENRPIRQAIPDDEARPGSRPLNPEALERASSLARREIARVEAAQGRADRHAIHRERAAAAAADAANAAAAAAAAVSTPTPPHINGRMRFHESDDMQRLNKVWARQETMRMKAGAEDAKMYDGIKYERKATGPFMGKLVSQGTIINIDGEDYVEYRVLTKPSFF